MYNSQQGKARVVMLWEHFLLLCQGDYIKALLIDRLIYYSQQHEALYDLLKEEQAEGVLPKFTEEVKLDKLSGWIRRPASYLAESLLIGESDRTVLRKLEELERENLIFRRTQKGRPAEYRPNLRYIDMRLHDLGFRLDGSRVEEQLPDPPPAEVTKEDQKEWWEQTPGVEKSQANGLDKLQVTEWGEWSAKNRFLDRAPDFIQKASWLIYQETGFEPVDKTWIGQVTALWKESGENEDVLVEGLRAGQTVRTEKRFTFSGPRGFTNYVRDIRARKNTLTNPIKVGANGNGKPKDDGVIRIGGRGTL